MTVVQEKNKYPMVVVAEIEHMIEVAFSCSRRYHQIC